MKAYGLVVSSIMLGVLVSIVPAYAQTSDRILILENFGSYDKNDRMFVFGHIPNLQDDSYLIMEIINPEGDLCQIQQLTPLLDGAFFTDALPLQGRICGMSGQYDIKVFYGDYSADVIFTVSDNVSLRPSSEVLTESARGLVSNQMDVIDNQFGDGSTFFDRITLANSTSDFEQIYVDLWDEFFSEELMFEINPIMRAPLTSSLGSIDLLQREGKLSEELANQLRKSVFSSIFHHEIGNTKESIDILSDVFVGITNVNPQKTEAKRTPTFDELEDTLLNLMKKSDTVMSKPVKEEIGFIFARGTAPLYSDEIGQLLDLLTHARYLDVISRSNSDLYRLVQSDWDSVKPSLESKDSLEELLESRERTAKLYDTALLLKDLGKVDRFISSDADENSELANMILPDYDNLESKLVLASSVDDILQSKDEITQMKQIIEISSRIQKAVDISKSTGINNQIPEWEELLKTVEQAESTDEILEVVTEFERTMQELREKRSPVELLRFEYQKMKAQAELQGDYQNLYMIDNALQILDTAKNMEQKNSSSSRIDRIEVLLTWASEKAPIIQLDLNSYDKDVFKIKAGNILQRAKSIENLSQMSLQKNQFLPGYLDYVESLDKKLTEIRDLVTKNDLDAADSMVRTLFDEWQNVSTAYENDPFGSDVGYNPDEIKRIQYREKLERFSGMAEIFYHSGFSDNAAEFNRMVSNIYNLIDYGNFVDTESKITEVGRFLDEHLTVKHPKIIYAVSFEPEKDIWVIEGAVDKPIHDRRENLYVTVYEMDGNMHSTLEFTDTRQGNFFTQWHAPTTPGLYVVTLQYQDSTSSELVHIEEKFDTVFTVDDLDAVDLSREFEELKDFMDEFGGEEYHANPRFASVTNEIKMGLTNRNSESVDANLSELKQIIERYLPVRSPSAVIETEYHDDKLILSGAVEKTLAFSEDLYVDVFDQKGELVETIELKDNSSGLFSKTISVPLPEGVYVAQLEYHDLAVTDFFNVR